MRGSCLLHGVQVNLFLDYPEFVLMSQSHDSKHTHAYTQRLGWHAVVVGGILLVMAPNLLFMLVSSFSQRRIASLEQAMFDSNAGKSATYENQVFCGSKGQQQQQPCPESRHQCSRFSGRMDSQPHLYFYSPAHTSRKAAFFYKPLDLQDHQQDGCSELVLQSPCLPAEVAALSMQNATRQRSRGNQEERGALPGSSVKLV